MRPKNGRFTQGPPFFLRSDVCSFLGRRSFSVALFVFLNLPFGRFIRDFRSFSAPLLVLFGAGSPFFLRFQCGAVLYFRCMARDARLFELAVSWLCECRLNHLDGGVNKKNTLPGGRPAKVEPAGARVRGAGEPQSGGQ